jgi:predicted ribosomally synthesized peptide with nif11-like leader
MSLQSATEFTNALTSNPELAAAVLQSIGGKSVSEAATIASDLGKQHGFDFTPEEAVEARNAYAAANPLSEDELDAVAGGLAGDPSIPTGTGTGIGIVVGRISPPGTGGVIGAGVGTGMATLIGGGSASEAVQAGAVAAAENLNDTRSAVQQFFSGW